MQHALSAIADRHRQAVVELALLEAVGLSTDYPLEPTSATPEQLRDAERQGRARSLLPVTELARVATVPLALVAPPMPAHAADGASSAVSIRRPGPVSAAPLDKLRQLAQTHFPYTTAIRLARQAVLTSDWKVRGTRMWTHRPTA